MQYNPSNNYGNPYVNQYPPVHQPQFGTENIYPPSDAPPAYSQYPQQPPGYQSSSTGSYGQTALYQQQGVVVVPVYQRRWNNFVATPITPNLKAFFIISGILSLILGILDIALEIEILLNAQIRTIYYHGFWTGGFLIGAGICMLIAACRTAYIMAYMIRMFSVILVFVIVGLIFCIVDLVRSVQCDSYYWFDCDSQLAVNLKITILAVFIFSTVHTIVNIVVAGNAQKKVNSVPNPNVPGY